MKGRAFDIIFFDRSRSRDRSKKDKKKKSGKDKAKAKAGKEPASSPVRKESKPKDDKPAVKVRLTTSDLLNDSYLVAGCAREAPRSVQVQVRGQGPGQERVPALQQDPHRAPDQEREQGASPGDILHLRQDQGHRVWQREDETLAE